MRLKDMKLMDFPFQTIEKVRYRDTDRQGHVNNAVFGTYFEAGRVALLYQPNLAIDLSQSAFVVVKITMELRGEIFWPNDVHIGVGVLHTSSSSLMIGSNLYIQGQVVASSETLLMYIDVNEKKSISLPQNLIKKLDAFLLK